MFPDCKFYLVDSIGKKISISNEIYYKNIHKIFMQNLNKSLPKSTSPPKKELGVGFDTYEFIWKKNNIQVMLGYWVEYKWIDKNNEIIEQDGTDIRSRIKGQKKFYRPKLKFTHLGLQKRLLTEDAKREQSFEKEKKQLENKRRQKDSEKF